MPTIFLNKKKYKKEKETSKRDNLNHKAVYNTRKWRELRLQFLIENPLCKRCIKENKFNSAVEVHHIIPISTVNTLLEKRTLGYDWNNLEGLCSKHHKEAHKNYN
ncbi:MAG: hypothetical protein GT598_15645 [Bacteroidales bacterium]|nr:hypothetical protein [Bacteroidales bacterium]